MNTEDFEILAKYDEKLMSLVKGATVMRGCTYKMQEDCGMVYQHIFNRTVSRSEWQCPHCTFNVYKQLATKYNEEKIKLEDAKSKSRRGRKPRQEPQKEQ